MKSAFITGLTGQDGSYLAELLLEKGYKVYGLVRRLSSPNVSRISHLLDKVEILEGDLGDQMSLIRALEKSRPDEFYNLAAQSFVGTSWQQPVLTNDYTGIGAIRALEATRQVNPKIRFYQASSSEMYGLVQAIPQCEKTPFYPRSPYAAAKVLAHYMTINYRESYGMFCVSGILFNHESPRRGVEFVTRKITHGVAAIKAKTQSKLHLGNLDAKRDWGYAKDYVEAMWLMLQQQKPEDFVISTGEAHSVREFCELAFNRAGLNWKDHVVTDEKFMRPAEVDLLLGDCTKAKKSLGWTPHTSFKELVNLMTDHDLKLAGQL